MTSIPNLVERLIHLNGGNTAQAAQQLGSSVASLSRYRSGNARPRKNLEERLKSIVDEGGDLVDKAEAKRDRRLSSLEQAIASTINALREEFHRTASVSNRQDVLDLVAVLVFAHVTSIDSGGKGLGRHLQGSTKSTAEAVNSFVLEALARHLPDVNGHGPGRSRFFIPLTSADVRFAEELLLIFERDASAFRQLHEAGRDDLINEVFSRFMATSFVDEKEMGQYLTPPEITRFMVEIGFHALDSESRADILDPEKCGTAGVVLDPSCGVGSFLAESIRFLQEQVRTQKPARANEWLKQFLENNVVGIDKSDRMLRLASINLGLFGVRFANLSLANSLARDGDDAKVTIPLEGKARLILTNPPFGASYGGADIDQFTMGQSKKRVDSEILFLERYIDWTAPGGVIVSIVPDSILVNRGVFSELRSLLRNKCEIVAVFSLPSVTFAAAGTNTKTSVLVLRRSGSTNASATFFGEVREVGYDVVTRAGQRRRIRHARNDLPALLSAFVENKEGALSRLAYLTSASDRWDAGFHVTPAGTSDPNGIVEWIGVADIAKLVDERRDPKKLGISEFNYIEISDVDARTGLVGHKNLPVDEAPSRARKIVRAGDVLVSTVRPERGAIGVVPKHLDGAICSTGFAVLRCETVHPTALAWLLKTDGVRRQMVRHNIGIAYPAIAEETCLSLQLPVDADGLSGLSKAGEALDLAQNSFEQARAVMIEMTTNPQEPTKTDPKPRRVSQTTSRPRRHMQGSG